MYFFVSDKEHNRYSFRSRGTLLLDNMDNNTNGFITNTDIILNNDRRLFIFGKKFTDKILDELIVKKTRFICDISDYKFFKEETVNLYNVQLNIVYVLLQPVSILQKKLNCCLIKNVT